MFFKAICLVILTETAAIAQQFPQVPVPLDIEKCWVITMNPGDSIMLSLSYEASWEQCFFVLQHDASKKVVMHRNSWYSDIEGRKLVGPQPQNLGTFKVTNDTGVVKNYLIFSCHKEPGHHWAYNGLAPVLQDQKNKRVVLGFEDGGGNDKDLNDFWADITFVPKPEPKTSK